MFKNKTKQERVVLDFIKNKSDEFRDTIGISSEIFPNALYLAYLIMKVEVGFGGKFKMWYRTLISNYIKKLIGKLKNITNKEEYKCYNKHYNSIPKGYSSIKESSLFDISGIEDAISIIEQINTKDYSGLTKKQNSKFKALTTAGIDFSTIHTDPLESYKALVVIISTIIKDVPNISEIQILAETLSISMEDATTRYNDILIADIEEVVEKKVLFENIISKLPIVITFLQKTLKKTYDFIIDKVAYLFPINFSSMLRGTQYYPYSITEKRLSTKELEALKVIAYRAVTTNDGIISYTGGIYDDLDYDNVGGTSTTWGTVKDALFNPYTKLKQTLGMANVIMNDNDEYVVVDTYDFNDYGENFGLINTIKENKDIYNIIYSIGAKYGKPDPLGNKITFNLGTSLEE